MTRTGLPSIADPPDTIDGWKALAEGLLTDQACVFHRNLEISSRYAWMYKLQPCLKWAGMAAFASHHVRIALYPFRLETDGMGYTDLTSSPRLRRALLRTDVDTIRATNNAIFDDIFWAHLAYVSGDDGIERLRAVVGEDRHYAAILAGFETIDRARRVLDDRTASTGERRLAREQIWEGNVQLLEHEQRALVQPNFDRLSCTFARLFSMGSSLSFEVRGVRHEIEYFSSFYTYAFGRGFPQVLQARMWPRVTRLEDRWRWIEASIVPRFRRIDADMALVDAGLRHIFDEASHHAAIASVIPQVDLGQDLPR